jgi:serine/threonine-protein kinase
MALPPDSPKHTAAEETVELQIAEIVAVRIGRYKLIEKIGAGGMGEIYLGEDERLNRKVALKILPELFTQDADRVRRFELEAKAASALNHPNIITIYEIGEADGAHYIVTEYIQGQTLRQQMAESLTIETALEVAIQIASALKAAHEVGIVHRDIKPENVMVRPDGLVKVLDFGIAKLIERPSPPQSHAAADNQATVAFDVDDPYPTHLDQFVTTPAEAPNETAVGIIMGTVTYMSPEQLRGQKVDARADIFSLGVVLYEVITGTSPFAGSTQADRIAAILEREPAPLCESRPEAPAEMDRIVKKALRKDRDTRYQLVEDVLGDLKDLKQELAFQAKLERSSQEHTVVLRSSGPGLTTPPHAAGQTTSTAEIILSEVKRHKRGALLSLATIILVTIAIAYFANARFGSAGSGITSIAVLPFTNSSNDPEKEYLSDGISESLINQLSRLPGLKVIANSSCSRYKGKDTNPRDIARALDTTGILTGRVSQLGDRLSISVELIDARDSTQVWGERYDRKATDLLAVQSEIAREITEKLRLRLTTGQRQHLSAAETGRPEAYDLLLKGYFFRARGSTEDRKKAGEYFQQAVARDPGYALAYAQLSDIYRSLVGSSILDPKEYLPKAEQAARKAIELDDGLADAHNALANLKTYAWEWDDAEREYKRAIELNPNLALAHRWYASFLRLMGRHEQAIGEIKRARDLDPLAPGVSATVGYIFFNARQYDQAIEALKETLELDQDYPYTHLFLGFTYTAKGMYAEAIAEYQKAIKLGLDTPATQIFLSAAYAQSGDRQRAHAILEQLRTRKELVSPGNLAILYAALGEREQAFASLEQAYQEHDSQLQYLGVEPGFDPLRLDQRFQDLLHRVGLSR